MEELFLKLVNMSITASWLVLAVILFRILLKNAPKYLRVTLWGLVGLRLALPISFESVLSLIPSTETLPEEFLYASTPQINTGLPAVNNSLNPIIAETLTPEGLTSANPTQILSFVFANIWLVGLILMLAYAVVSFLMVRRKVGASIPYDKHVRLCDDIHTPFILGIIRPKIYLPSTLDEDVARHVLAHEYAHLKRHDHWWKPLGYLLLCVYWFNPVMWLAYILLCRDIEMACDEKVIKELDGPRKKAYSAALLQCSVPRRMIAACPLAFGEVGVKDRIRSVLSYKKPAFWVILVAVIASIVVAVCFMTDPAGKPLAEFGRDNDDRVLSISVDSGDDNYGIYTETGIEFVLELLEDIHISRNEISQNRSEDRDCTHTITLHYEKYDCRYCFNEDWTEVWYDNSVKPSLTHKVMNPERAEEFFLSSIEAPAADRLAPGEYITTELVYWPLYSSYHWETDPAYRYTVSEDSFYSEYEGETFTVDWQWRTVSQSATELLFFYQWYETMSEVGVEGIPPIDASTPYQRIDEKHHIFLIDEEIYLVEGWQTGVAMTNVSAIYKLAVYDDTDVPLTYPDSADSNAVSHLYSTISGQIYDSRDGIDALIRDAIFTQYQVHKSDDVFYGESHQILSELIACGAAAVDGEPCGYRVVEVVAVLCKIQRNDSGIPRLTAEPQLVKAKITMDEFPDTTLKLSKYEELPADAVDGETAMIQVCYDQAVKYWGVNTDLMIDSLLRTISSPAHYSSTDAYIEAHWDEYEQLVHLGRYTLEYCFNAFLNNQASDMRAEIMARACREIGSVMGEDIDFEGEYINSPTWFEVFYDNAMKLYEEKGLEPLAESNRASWVLLDILGKTAVPIAPEEYGLEVIGNGHYSNGVKLFADVTFPESIKVTGGEDDPFPDKVKLTYLTVDGETQVTANSVLETAYPDRNTIRYELIFELDDPPTGTDFTVTLEGLGTTLTQSYQADVAPAATFSWKDGTSNAKLSISPIVLMAEVYATDIKTVEDLQQTIRILDRDGNPISISGSFGGAQGGNLVQISIQLNKQVDTEDIGAVYIGDIKLISDKEAQKR